MNCNSCFWAMRTGVKDIIYCNLHNMYNHKKSLEGCYESMKICKIDSMTLRLFNHQLPMTIEKYGL